MTVRVLRSRAEFSAVRDAWMDLRARALVSSPFLHWHWIDRFWEELVRPGSDAAITTVWDGDRLTGAAPFIISRPRAFGLTTANGMENPHTLAYEWLLPADAGAAQEAANEIAVALPGLAGPRALVTWRNAPAESAATRVARVALQGAGWRVIWRPQRPHRVIHFPRGAEAFVASLSANMRARLRKSVRRLDDMGSARFEQASRVTDLNVRLGRAWDLEARGWKGRKGTSVKQDEKVRKFYDSVAAHLATEDRFVLFELTCNDRLVCFFYGVREADRLWGLKFSYDRDFARASPGHVIILRIIEWAQVHRIVSVDLGPDSDFKAHWAGEVQPMGSVHAVPRGISGAAALAHLAGHAAIRRVRKPYSWSRAEARD